MQLIVPISVLTNMKLMIDLINHLVNENYIILTSLYKDVEVLHALL